MKLNCWKIFLAMVGVWAGGLAAQAGPLLRNNVPADPAWVVHLDCDALRPTTIGQYILSQMDKPDAKTKLAAFQTIFGLELRTQLHGLTLYGGGPAPQDGVLIVYANFEADHLVTLAKAADDYQSSTHNQHTIHSWVEQNKHSRQSGGTRKYAAIQGHRVIFGQREATVAEELDVLDGTAPSLEAKKNFGELGAGDAGHFLEAAARKMNFPDSTPRAAILKLLKGARLMLGEKQGQVRGALTLTADNEDVSGQVYAIAQGLLSLMKLAQDKPESARLADALAVKQDGARVLITLAMPGSEAVELMKADAARKAAARDSGQ